MTMTFHELCDEVKKNVKEITIDDLKKMQAQNENFKLFDTREESEFNAGRIKNSRHLGKGIIERDIHKYADGYNDKIVLYCGGGYRSALAADNLQKMGYTNVLSLDGGWRRWTESNGETEG
ncbi:rhodanese-like domain-containing protein [soil metagenome]